MFLLSHCPRNAGDTGDLCYIDKNDNAMKTYCKKKGMNFNSCLSRQCGVVSWDLLDQNLKSLLFLRAGASLEQTSLTSVRSTSSLIAW